MCVSKYPLKLFLKSRLFIVSDGRCPRCWNGFNIIENSNGESTALYRLGTSPSQCLQTDEKTNQKSLLAAINKMIRDESIDPISVNRNDFINDIMVSLIGWSFYTRPDIDGSLWKKYPNLFKQMEKPVEMQETDDGFSFTYVVWYAIIHHAELWTLHTKKNGELISFDYHEFVNIREDTGIRYLK
jgi:hypothetical protein